MTAASFGPRLNPQGGVTFREGIGEARGEGLARDSVRMRQRT
jgi:hypothetical protein